jgi:hypothetical protein
MQRKNAVGPASHVGGGAAEGGAVWALDPGGYRTAPLGQQGFRRASNPSQGRYGEPSPRQLFPRCFALSAVGKNAITCTITRSPERMVWVLGIGPERFVAEHS